MVLGSAAALFSQADAVPLWTPCGCEGWPYQVSSVQAGPGAGLEGGDLPSTAGAPGATGEHAPLRGYLGSGFRARQAGCCLIPVSLQKVLQMQAGTDS